MNRTGFVSTAGRGGGPRARRRRERLRGAALPRAGPHGLRARRGVGARPPLNGAACQPAPSRRSPGLAQTPWPRAPGPGPEPGPAPGRSEQGRRSRRRAGSGRRRPGLRPHAAQEELATPGHQSMRSRPHPTAEAPARARRQRSAPGSPPADLEDSVAGRGLEQHQHRAATCPAAAGSAACEPQSGSATAGSEQRAKLGWGRGWV